jgi:hypothetical protein
MKYRITMKDPDGFSESVSIAARDSVKNVKGVADDEREDLEESRRNQLCKQAGKWFEYDEYLTVEIDTEANTCVVIPRK